MADALFIGAHPDDAELFAGGLMASLAVRGHSVVLADATAGEFGTRGTVDERAAEGAEAARILGVKRVCLQLRDGAVGTDLPAAVRAVVTAIREHRPRLVVTHAPGDHHPDHNAISTAVKQGFFMANVLNYVTSQERFAPQRLLHFWGHRHRVPDQPAFVSDISAHYETKIASLRAHRSQFHNPDYDAPKTFVSSEAFWQAVEARAAYYGSLIGVRYGEAFLSENTLRVDDPLSLPDLLAGEDA